MIGHDGTLSTEVNVKGSYDTFHKLVDSVSGLVRALWHKRLRDSLVTYKTQ
jgi:hypothetical protein